MTIFGRTLDGTEIASLISLLLVLVLWIGAWRSNREWTRGIRQWEADRKSRRDAERANGGDGPASGAPRGPWG